ncbi:hydrogen peroxide-inducible genes activator [Aquirufa aurantiipilula]|uniref:Hydrogen peroxide-inducible genes activator n=1 Tax=Aquirufa aurantiipilula TaxID=2696561 RepID=A0ABT6BKX6_9BACT|nr:hydrogen peroxide-inducible genes activator [Aquirufa aurantiipilula]MDF5689443.1 hydrogen peroxide-inducible genes activator [Aquirufa aurantiipilula]
MNIHQLEYILAVDQFKSFSKAADYCHVTQATLSAMVKKLEEQLDIVIFDRKANPIVVTENGKEILVQAQQVVAHAQALLASSKSINSKIEGRLKLGIIPTIANSLMPIILKPILEKYPQLVLEIYEVTTHQMMKNLREGKLDMGILSTPIASNDLETTLLYEEPVHVYGYLDHGKKTIKKEELSKQRIFLLQEGHCLRDQIIQWCDLKKNKHLPPNLLFESNTFDTLLNLVDEFQGMTLLPELYLRNLSDQRKLQVLDMAGGEITREVSLCFYRPYAKWNIVKQLSVDIAQLVNQFIKKDTV